MSNYQPICGLERSLIGERKISVCRFTARVASLIGHVICFRLALILTICILLSGNGSAQVVDPVTAAGEPIPGVGHHYVGIGSETVNPADGSVSFQLPIDTPTGRQLSLSFGISYSSAEPFFITNGGTNSQFHWSTPAQNGWPPPFELDGWSYQLPTYEANAFVAYSVASPTSNPPDSFVYDYCWATENYTFRGPGGSRYPLNVTNAWPDPGNPDLNACTHSNQGSYSGAPLYGVAASLATGGTSTQPVLTVTDQSGTVYQFSQGPSISTSPTVVTGGGTPFGSLAQTITDKNGNQIKLNGTGVVAYGNLLPAGGYTDTAGRPVLEWTGIGSTSGDQISVSGLSENIVVKWTTRTVTLPDTSEFVSASFGSSCGFTGPQAIPVTVVSEIDLPNGQKYSFSYGGTWGLLQQITFPNGGYVRYLWGSNSRSTATYQTWSLSGPNESGPANCIALVDTPAITDRYVSYDGKTEVLHQQFSGYSTQWNYNAYGQPSWSSKTTNVTSSDLISGQTTVTKYTYSPVTPQGGPGWYSWQAPAEIPVEQTVIYQDGGNNTLKTINKTWLDQFAMIGDQTILDNKQGMTTLQCPDSSDRILAIYEYNFQSVGAKPSDPTCSVVPPGGTTLSSGLNASAIGPLLRQTITVYHDFGSTHILDEPDSVSIYDGLGSLAKQTTYLYDGGAVVPSGTKTGLVSPPGLRGNATSVSRWVSSGNPSVTTTYTYYDTGQIQSMTDPCGNVACPDMTATNHMTTYSYLDKYAAGTGSPSAQTNTYLTQVTYPNTGTAHQESYAWGFNDGLLRSHTDQNTQTWNYQYNDPLLRLKSVTGPPDPNNNNQSPTTTYTYFDWTPTNPTASSITKSELENTSGTYITSNTVMDGMGHTTYTQMTPSSLETDTVHTVYDGLGQVYSVSNPYGSAPASTDGTTIYGYDALGRKTSQLDSDGVSAQSWTYFGNTVVFKDENQNQWQRNSDALGRLSLVLEPNGVSQTASMETDYVYDALDNLRSVEQCGGGCPSVSTVARRFNYDGLSRLLQSFNPESGWICYGTAGGAVPNGSNCVSGYDANGNLAKKTDARNVTLSYSYDALNRVLSKRYSSDASNTPSSCFQYDLSSVPNSAGRLTNQWTQSASVGACATAPPTSGIWTKRAILAYDSVGHVINEQQCTPSNCSSGSSYGPSNTYDLAGNLTGSTNGITTTPTVNTLKFTSVFDGAARLQSLTSNWNDGVHPSGLFSAQTASTSPCPNSTSYAYAPFGGLMNATFGNGLTLSRAFDNRLRTTCEMDTGSIVATPTSGSATVTITGSEQQQ